MSPVLPSAVFAAAALVYAAPAAAQGVTVMDAGLAVCESNGIATILPPDVIGEEPPSANVSDLSARWTEYGGTAGAYRVYAFASGWVQVRHWVYDYATDSYLWVPGYPWCRAV